MIICRILTIFSVDYIFLLSCFFISYNYVRIDDYSLCHFLTCHAFKECNNTAHCLFDEVIQIINALKQWFSTFGSWRPTKQYKIQSGKFPIFGGIFNFSPLQDKLI